MKITLGMKRGLCLIFAIVMIISGMCFAGSTDSFSDYPKTQNSTDPGSIQSVPFTQDEHHFVEELSGLRVASSLVERTGRTPLKSGVKMGLVLFLLAVLLVNFHYFTKLRQFSADNDQCSRRFIIRYIHQQDGSKS